MQQPTILITGASGQYGQKLLKCLIEKHGISRSALILLTRDPLKLASYSESGSTVRKGSFDDPLEDLTATFRGAEIVFMISTSRAGARLPQHQNAINAAKAAGAKHIVYTSFVGTDRPTPTALVAQEHRATEEMLRESGLAWTALRDSMYIEAMTGVVIPGALQTGVLAANAGDGKVAFVSRDDCVEAAAAVLKSSQAHENVAYNITGPELLTWAEVGALASNLSGKTIEWRELTEEENFEVFDAMGIPRHPAGDEFEKTGVKGITWNSTDMVSFGKAIRLGELSVISEDFEKLTGRRPRSMESVLAASLRA
jgi:NAD(P)H dehydrogenase (quinone)